MVSTAVKASMEAVWKRVRLPPAPNQRKVVMEKSLYYIGKRFRWCLRFRYITAELAGDWVLIKFWSEEPYFSEGRWGTPDSFTLRGMLHADKTAFPLMVTRENQSTLIWDMEERPDGNSNVR